MDLDRRAFLSTLAAAAALPACSQEPGPEPDEPWQPEGSVDEDSFATGVQVGDASANGAFVSVRSAEDVVLLGIARGTASGWADVDELTLTPDSGGVAQGELRDLRPDTTYSVAARTADGRRSTVSRFRTAPAEGQTRVLNFGATSCLGSNFPWPSLSHAAGEQLDLFLLLGDTIYNDWWDGDLADKWAFALGQQGMRDLCASTSLLATWDDHEVWNNWNPTSQADRAQDAIIEMRRALPMARGGGAFELWRSVRWGDVAEFFVLDCRGERDGDLYMSDEQLQWLEEGLASSAARFKILLNSVPITDLSTFGAVGQFGADDRWQGFPAQRSRLLQHVADAGVTGVLFVSGDFHIGAVTLVDAEGGPAAGIHEVLTGPGGSPIADEWSLVPEGGRILAAVAQHNYTRFRCNANTGVVTVTYVGDDGTELRRLELQL